MLTRTLDLTSSQLRALILSHGWYTLDPFIAQTNPPKVSIAFDLPIGSGLLEVKGGGSSCKLTVINGSLRNCFIVATNCLSLDVNISEFHVLASKGGEKWTWIIENHMGKFLRSPSLFEDCVKVLTTTNTTWGRTAKMVNNLTRFCGKRVGDRNAFPAPDKILSHSETTLRKEVGCGFRAKYLLKIAEKALRADNIFLDFGWRELNKHDFYKLIVSLPGIGDVSANYLSLIYSMPFGFNIDAYVKRRCMELWGIPHGQIHEKCTERYGRFGVYAPLVLWLELTRHWHSRESYSDNNVW